MRKLILGMVTSGLLLSSMGVLAEDEAPGPFTFSGNIALTTDYAFRGISQTDENPAVQGGFNVNHESGFYAGTWASNLDFNEDETGGVDGATLELDIFAGFAGKFGESGFGFDVGVLGYLYPGADDDRNYDYAEGFVGLTYNVFSAKYYYSPEFFAESGTAGYIDVTANVPLPNDFGFIAHVGHQTIDENATFGTPDYTDFRIGVNKKVAGFGFDLSYIDTDLDDDECFGGTVDWCDGRVIFTVSRSL